LQNLADPSVSAQDGNINGGNDLSPSTDTVTSTMDPNPIPAQVSIPVQFQNGGMGAMDLSQQMSDLDLNIHSSSALQPGSSSAAVGMPSRQGGMVEFSSQNRGGGFNSSYTGAPIMYSENYPQGALYMGSNSPMMTSWQYNHNSHPNQGIK
jgi:hypothetical protein